MSDATEWLVEYMSNGATLYERFANVNDAIPFLHKVIGNGQRPRLYKETPIALTIDLGIDTPKAPKRRHRKKDKSGAATPRAEENAEALRTSPALPTADPPPSPVSLIPTGKEEESPKEGAERRPAPSPVCEASWPGDPACPGPAVLDPATGAWFCGFHLVQVPESFRYEMHRIHGSRNRPVVRLAG